LQEGIDAISDVIQHKETYDVTTIRASTPMFLMGHCALIIVCFVLSAGWL
jgi:asparagine synthetase B (glutamine-hydrolysing)